MEQEGAGRDVGREAGQDSPSRASKLASELATLPDEELLTVVPMLEQLMKRAAKFQKDSYPRTCFLEVPVSVLCRLWPAERVVVGRRVCKMLHQELLNYAQDILLVHRPYSKGQVEEGAICEDLLRLRRQPVQMQWSGMHKMLRELEPEENERDLQKREVILRAIRSLSSSVNDFLPIVHLQYSCQELEKADVEVLVSFIQKLPSLTHLNLGMNSMRDDCLGALSVMGTNTTLTHLELGGNEFEDAGDLDALLSQFPALEFLGLNRNRLTDAGLMHLADALPASVTHLDVSYNEFESTGCILLCGRLASLAALCTLDLGSNNLGNAGLAELAETLHLCSALTELRVDNVEAETHDGAAILGTVLPRCAALATLHLGGRWGHHGAMRDPDIVDAGWGELLAQVGRCPRLRALELCGLRPDRCELVAGPVRRCVHALAHTLTRFHIRLSWLEPCDAAAMAEVLGDCVHLEQVGFDRTGLKPDAVVRLVLALSTCTRLARLQLDGNRLGESVTQVAQVLAGGAARQPPAFKALRVLEVQDCYIPIEAGERMRAAFRNAGMLPDLQVIGLPEPGQEAIEQGERAPAATAESDVTS